MATIRESLDRAAELIGGKAWGVDRLTPRIYMPSRRDAKVFFAFPDACYTSADDVCDAIHCLGGACLRIYIEDCGQHPNWYAGQKRRIAGNLRREGLALDAIHAGNESLAEQIMEMDDDLTDTQIDEASRHLANLRLTEAREVLGLAEATA